VTDENKSNSRQAETATPSSVSRRDMLTAGLAVAGAGLAGVQAAEAQGKSAGAQVGVTTDGSIAVEFRARLAQTGAAGDHFVAYGYLTRVVGTDANDLFAGSTENETTALLTAYATGDLVRRTIDQSVHSLDIEGFLTVYQRSGPGASFADPDSFQLGTEVARFALKLQDVLTVFAPARGIPTLTGDMQQTLAARFSNSSHDASFGHLGAGARLFATGIGTLVDPVTLNANLEMAGNWSSK
jgi:hypothetical protein